MNSRFSVQRAQRQRAPRRRRKKAAERPRSAAPPPPLRRPASQAQRFARRAGRARPPFYVCSRVPERNSFACAHLPSDAVVDAAVLDLDRQVAALVEPPELRVRRVVALAVRAAHRRAAGDLELLAHRKRGGHATVARVGHGELRRVQLRRLVAVLARRGVVARQQHRRVGHRVAACAPAGGHRLRDVEARVGLGVLREGVLLRALDLLRDPVVLDQRHRRSEHHGGEPFEH